MELRLLLIHGDRPRDLLYKTILSSVEPAMDISIAQTREEIESHPLPVLILLDLDLSLPSSLEILEWLRSEKSYHQIPVIALTSTQTADRVNRAYELGANSCVMKTENGLMAEIARGIASFARILSGWPQAA